jgi:chromosome partitioning protein
VVTIANMKGGVGKTNTLLGLALSFALGVCGDSELRVLVIDMDAQSNASFWLCGDMVLSDLIEKGRTIDAFLEDTIVAGQELKLTDYVVGVAQSQSVRSLAIVPSSPGLRNVERELVQHLSKSNRNLEVIEGVVSSLFASHLAQLRPKHDIVLIDTGPGITALTQAAIRLSDLVIVPTVPDFISSLGLEAFCKTVMVEGADGSLVRQLPQVLVSRYRGDGQHTRILEELRKEAESEDRGFRLFRTIVPDAPEANIASMFSERVFPNAEELRPGIMAALGREVLEVLHGGAA